MRRKKNPGKKHTSRNSREKWLLHIQTREKDIDSNLYRKRDETEKKKHSFCINNNFEYKQKRDMEINYEKKEKKNKEKGKTQKE